MFGLGKKEKEEYKRSEEERQKTLKGTVVSDKMDKTVTVLVKRFVKHPKYKKFMMVHKKYKAHDAENLRKVGDKVTIVSSRPLSRGKRFKVLENNEH